MSFRKVLAALLLTVGALLFTPLGALAQSPTPSERTEVFVMDEVGGLDHGWVAAAVQGERLPRGAQVVVFFSNDPRITAESFNRVVKVRVLQEAPEDFLLEGRQGLRERAFVLAIAPQARRVGAFGGDGTPFGSPSAVEAVVGSMKPAAAAGRWEDAFADGATETARQYQLLAEQAAHEEAWAAGVAYYAPRALGVVTGVALLGGAVTAVVVFTHRRKAASRAAAEAAAAAERRRAHEEELLAWPGPSAGVVQASLREWSEVAERYKKGGLAVPSRVAKPVALLERLSTSDGPTREQKLDEAWRREVTGVTQERSSKLRKEHRKADYALQEGEWAPQWEEQVEALALKPLREAARSLAKAKSVLSPESFGEADRALSQARDAVAGVRRAVLARELSPLEGEGKLLEAVGELSVAFVTVAEGAQVTSTPRGFVRRTDYSAYRDSAWRSSSSNALNLYLMLLATQPPPPAPSHSFSESSSSSSYSSSYSSFSSSGFSGGSSGF